MNRRSLLLSALYLGAFLSLSTLGGMPGVAQSVDVNAILNDPDAPTAGNPRGDVTIVSFFDYNCPYCKKSAPELEKFARTDGNIRVVYKDWPILGEASRRAARSALAANYQGQYEQVHTVLLANLGPHISSEQMEQAIEKSGVDMGRLHADLEAHGADIDALLKRNAEQAAAMGLQGTPVYLIGPFLAAAPLDYSAFKQAVAKLRAGGKPAR
jgi:protein-disulfide isomerase